MKKLGATLLSVGSLACLGVVLFNQRPTQQAKADGDVRIIASDSEFEAFKTDLLDDEMEGKTIRLDADINYTLTGALSSEGAMRGTFDGNGHTITISVSCEPTTTLSLFRSIGSQGIVSNLTIEGTITGTSYVAGIAARNYGLIQNCTNKATITGTGTYVAGIAGLANKEKTENVHARVINCKNYGDISSTHSSSASLGLGGIVGYSFGNSTIESCSNYGTVTSGTAPFGVGGILGVIKSTSAATGDVYLTNCYNAGDVNGDRYVGGILGHIDSDNVKKVHVSGCLNAGNITYSNKTKGYDGQLIGNAKSSSSFTLESSAIIGKLSAKTTNSDSDHIGQVIGYPKADTYSGVNVATTAGVSSNVKKVIELVRNFDCEADASYKAELNTALESLTSDEETMLSGVTYWDKAEGADKDYISAAYYILGYSATPSRMNVLNKNNALLYIVIAISFVSLSGLVMVLVIRKKKTNL